LLDILPDEIDDLGRRPKDFVAQAFSIFPNIEPRLKTHGFFGVSDEFFVFG
jgi:hypothetical protein